MNSRTFRVPSAIVLSGCILLTAGALAMAQEKPKMTAEERGAARRADAERRIAERVAQVEKRLEDLKAKTEQNPDDYKALAEYGLALAKVGKIDEGIAAITRAVTRAPDEPQILLLQAKTYWKAERPDLAVEAALKVTKSPLATNAEIAEAFFTAGSVRMNETRFEDAEKFLRRAIEADEKNVGALVNLGLLKSQNSQGAEALRLLEMAAKHAPDNARVQSTYALYLEEIGLVNRAHGAWARLVEIVPDDVDLRIKVGSSFIIQQEYEKAREHIAKAVELSPYDANAHLLYSQILLRMGDFAGAREHATTAGDLGARADQMLSAIDFEEQQANPGVSLSGS